MNSRSRRTLCGTKPAPVLTIMCNSASSQQSQQSYVLIYQVAATYCAVSIFCVRVSGVAVFVEYCWKMSSFSVCVLSLEFVMIPVMSSLIFETLLDRRATMCLK